MNLYPIGRRVICIANQRKYEPGVVTAHPGANLITVQWDDGTVSNTNPKHLAPAPLNPPPQQVGGQAPQAPQALQAPQAQAPPLLLPSVVEIVRIVLGSVSLYLLSYVFATSMSIPLLLIWTKSMPLQKYPGYVPRPHLDEKIRMAMVPFGNVVVVLGAKGSGKTTAVLSALGDRESTVFATLGHLNAFTFDELVMNQVSYVPVKKDDIRGSTLSKALYWRKWLSRTIPTFVFEISDYYSADSSIVKALYKEVKEVVGRDLGRVVFVMSDASAVSALPPDPFRQKLILVEDFTPAEAHQCLVTKVPAITADQVPEILERVGRRPLFLKNVSPLTWFEFVTELEESAVLAVETAAKKYNVLLVLMCQLLEYPIDVGIKETVAKYVKRDEATSLCQKHNVCLFHSSTKTYRFFSQVHYRAARTTLNCSDYHVPIRASAPVATEPSTFVPKQATEAPK